MDIFPDRQGWEGWGITLSEPLCTLQPALLCWGPSIHFGWVGFFFDILAAQNQLDQTPLLVALWHRGSMPDSYVLFI